MEVTLIGNEFSGFVTDTLRQSLTRQSRGTMPRPQHATAANRIINQEDLIMLGLMTRVQTRITNLKEFCQDGSGATAIEYGLIAAGIAVAIIAAVFALGDEVKGFFEDIQRQLASK